MVRPTLEGTTNSSFSPKSSSSSLLLLFSSLGFFSDISWKEKKPSLLSNEEFNYGELYDLSDLDETKMGPAKD